MKLHYTDAQTSLASLGIALSHPSRIRIITLLIKKGNLKLKDFTDNLSFSTSTVYKHISLLKKMGIIVEIKDEENPRAVSYGLADDVLEKIKELQDFTRKVVKTQRKRRCLYQK
ncbi:MAG: winged helix-turn-helix transcriptional regulator [Bacteroidales bacterium]|nr:winged helix-turn-helix transcriptional regulator [Bacteroidales bacterium]